MILWHNIGIRFRRPFLQFAQASFYFSFWLTILMSLICHLAVPGHSNLECQGRKIICKNGNGEGPLIAKASASINATGSAGCISKLSYWSNYSQNRLPLHNMAAGCYWDFESGFRIENWLKPLWRPTVCRCCHACWVQCQIHTNRVWLLQYAWVLAIATGAVATRCYKGMSAIGR